MSSEPKTFSLFSSLRYDPVLLSSPENAALSGLPDGGPCPFYLLSHHRDRMLAAAATFSWCSAGIKLLSDLELFHKHCQDAVASHFGTREHGPLKLKTLLSPAGELTVETSDVAPLPSLDSLFPPAFPGPANTRWRAHVDIEATTASEFTSFKTTARDMYDAARRRVGIQSFAAEEEVLLWNRDGEFMEGSLTSCYFFRDGKWVTPALASGGQGGTVRRWALQTGKVVEGTVKKEELKSGEWVVVSNGVRGVWGALVV